MSRDARWKALLELLVERGRLDVEVAAAELAVSAATIRRDFDQLAEQQMLVRTRGGAVVHGVSYELPLRYRMFESMVAPQARRAAGLDLEAFKRRLESVAEA